MDNDKTLATKEDVLAEVYSVAQICEDLGENTSGVESAIYKLVADTIRRRVCKPVLDEYSRAKVIVREYERG